MLRIALLALSINAGSVESDIIDEFTELEDCEIFAIMMQEDAIMQFRFGYEPQGYVCDIIEERQA